MAEVGYNSKFEGLEVDSRLEKVIQAEVATAEAEGKGGLIPSPPAGSQDGGKTLLSNMTWGEHVTKQYIDDAVSAAGWKKQIVSALPEVDAAKDNVMYLVKDDLASTETKNVYNEYILVTDEEGVKSLEALGMVSTGVEMTFLDLDQFGSSSGTVSDDVYNSVVSAYENKIVVGVIDGSITPITIYKTTIESSVVYNISLNYISNSYSRDVSELANRFIILNEDKSFTVDDFNYDIYGYYIDFLKFMTMDPSVVTTLKIFLKVVIIL